MSGCGVSGLMVCGEDKLITVGVWVWCGMLVTGCLNYHEPPWLGFPPKYIP